MGFRPIPENAERNRMGWRIVKTLTAHPALKVFEDMDEKEMIRICKPSFRLRWSALPPTFI